MYLWLFSSMAYVNVRTIINRHSILVSKEWGVEQGNYPFLKPEKGYEKCFQDVLQYLVGFTPRRSFILNSSFIASPLKTCVKTCKNKVNKFLKVPAIINCWAEFWKIFRFDHLVPGSYKMLTCECASWSHSSLAIPIYKLIIHMRWPFRNIIKIFTIHWVRFHSLPYEVKGCFKEWFYQISLTMSTSMGVVEEEIWKKEAGKWEN